MMVTMMLRATLFALAFICASAFEFVSQSFKGNFKFNYSDPSVPVPTTSTLEFGVDMESVKFRTNQHLVLAQPHMNITTSTKASMIVDVKAKRATFYHDLEINASIPIPTPPAACKYFEFPDLPAPAVVSKCLQDVAALAKPMSSEDGLQKFQIQIPLPQLPDPAEEVVYTDESFIMKKLVADENVPGPHPMTVHVEMTDMDSKAGAPDSSVFVVPAEWGTCTKDTMPPIPTINNPVMKAFLHCMGMVASQASVVV